MFSFYSERFSSFVLVFEWSVNSRGRLIPEAGINFFKKLFLSPSSEMKHTLILFWEGIMDSERIGDCLFLTEKFIHLPVL